LVEADLEVGLKSKRAITLSDDGPSMTYFWSSSLHHPNEPCFVRRHGVAMTAILCNAHVDPRNKQRGFAATVAHDGIHLDAQDFVSTMIQKIRRFSQ